MLGLFNLLRWILLDLFRSRRSLEGEVIALRHQLNVLRRSTPKRPALRSFDRLIFILLYRLSPTVVDAMTIVRPETIMRWHRAGFRSFWRWKSRRRPGRPKVPLEVRQLIREISLANPLWGAPRIHGELLKLGIDVGQTSVAKYMARRRRHHRRAGERSSGTMQMGSPRSTFSWFRRSPSGCYTGCWSSDTIEGASCGSASLRTRAPNGSPSKSRRHVVGRAHHTRLIRDRDRVYGEAFTRRVRAMGIRDRPTAPRSPWENGHAERLIGSIRRECLDHVIVFGERHLRHVLRSYARYYNGVRTHLSLGKDLPLPRGVQAVGGILPLPILGGLHHHYVRI